MNPISHNNLFKMLNRKLKMSALALFIAGSVFAGNRDRSGQAGAGELLLNPWARSSGLFGLNAANVSGRIVKN
jgi:hypothetical protein